MNIKEVSSTGNLSRAATNGYRDVTPEAEKVVMCCPRCRSSLDSISTDVLRCRDEQHTFQRVDGVWRMMLAERVSYFQTFLQDYETVRRGEGRGGDAPEYYCQLPFSDVTGRFSDDWRIRATSFRALIDRALKPIELRQGRPLTIFDVGAGNCWLSNRLSARGHDVVAVDLLTNVHDGLGAHVHYDTHFMPVQAEFNYLPFADNQADVVIFNGSLHYSTDFEQTLGEALRILSDDGQLVIVDTPVYRDPASGHQMVSEREDDFERHYGFRSNAIPSENFLTYDRLDALAQALNLQWRTIEPNYGLAWRLRPWKARLKRHREPARFLLIVGSTEMPGGSQHSIARAIARRILGYRFRLFQSRRYNALVIEQVAGKPFVVLPQVFNPKLLRSGEFLAETLGNEMFTDGAAVLDMGTGSGVGAVASASWAGRVVAVDINSAAVRCARINALLNEVDDKIDVREGDLFVPVEGERFDIVLFNPPYFRGVPSDALDHAWRSVDVVERFAAGLSQHLRPGGIALIVLSTDGDAEAFLGSFRQHGYSVQTYAHKKMSNETLTIYQLTTKGTHADVDSL